MERVQGARLRVYTAEGQRVGRTNLHHAILARAYAAGLAGVTVYRGIEGYGSHHVIHSADLLDLAAHLPVLVEIVDARDKVEAFMASLEGMDVRLMTVDEMTMYLPDAPGREAASSRR